jgi:hypothetical protein
MNPQKKVYKDQGGNRQVIAPGGELNLQGAISGLSPGVDYFVDSVNGSDSNDGLSWANAFATWDHAINEATADNGDRIFLAPWHAENLAAADTVDLDKAGIETIGITRGNQMPTFSSTAAAGGITVDAAGVTVRNIKLVANFTGGSTSAINVAAAGDNCLLENIVARDTAAGKEWLIHVSVATTVGGLTIRGCDFRGLVGESMTNSILFAGTSSNVTIEDTHIQVDSADDTVDHLTAAATNFLRRRCTVINGDTTTALYCVRLEATSTGLVHDCRFAYNKIDAEVSLGAAAWWLKNWASNTIADGGVAEPAGAAALP